MQPYEVKTQRQLKEVLTTTNYYYTYYNLWYNENTPSGRSTDAATAMVKHMFVPVHHVHVYRDGMLNGDILHFYQRE